MNDQTFHTPSFGDEEFDIPQFNHHLTSMDQNHQYHQHLDPTQQQQQQQQQQAAPQYVQQQWHDMNAGGGYGMHQQSPYMQQMGQQQQQQQQQQNNHYQSAAQTQMPPQHMSSPQGNSNQTGAPPSSYHAMGQSPHHGMQQSQHQPQQQQQNNVIVENGIGSEDSDDAIPATTLKRPSPDHYSDSGLHQQQPYATNGAGSMVDSKTTNAAKKQKVPKKKKKKDPNEPQKPVSAYALFFRDTQAAIKGQNPNASFGEVSKIVASMWDVLDTDSKNVYKKRTEVAKKEYLKALAAYRANAVSKESSEGSPSQDSVYSPPHGQSNAPPAQMQSPPQQQPQMDHLQTGMSSPMQNSYGQNMYQQPAYRSPQQMVQQQMHQHYNSPPSQTQFDQHPMNHHQMSPPQQQQQQQQQMMSQQNHYQQHQLPPGMPQNGSPAHHPGQNPNPGQTIMEPNGTMTCIRHGCRNPAIVSSDWEDEYCSNECVITHCRDVFGNWVQTNQQQPQTYSAVK
ncbi:TOX high mobility group box family member 3-like isoform X2 [Culicoides brevitarsis]